MLLLLIQRFFNFYTCFSAIFYSFSYSKHHISHLWDSNKYHTIPYHTMIEPWTYIFVVLYSLNISFRSLSELELDQRLWLVCDYWVQCIHKFEYTTLTPFTAVYCLPLPHNGVKIPAWYLLIIWQPALHQSDVFTWGLGAMRQLIIKFSLFIIIWAQLLEV